LKIILITNMKTTNRAPINFFDEVEKFERPNKINWWWIVDYGFVFMMLVAFLFIWLYGETKSDLNWIRDHKDAYCLTDLYEK